MCRNPDKVPAAPRCHRHLRRKGEKRGLSWLGVSGHHPPNCPHSPCPQLCPEQGLCVSLCHGYGSLHITDPQYNQLMVLSPLSHPPFYGVQDFTRFWSSHKLLTHLGAWGSMSPNCWSLAINVVNCHGRSFAPVVGSSCAAVQGEDCVFAHSAADPHEPFSALLWTLLAGKLGSNNESSVGESRVVEYKKSYLWNCRII